MARTQPETNAKIKDVPYLHHPGRYQGGHDEVEASHNRLGNKKKKSSIGSVGNCPANH
jgi:hypothetical protein